MNRFLRNLAWTVFGVVCFTASTQMFGLFLFIPFIMWFWWAKHAPTPADDLDGELLDLLDREARR